MSYIQNSFGSFLYLVLKYCQVTTFSKWQKNQTVKNLFLSFYWEFFDQTYVESFVLA